MRLIPSTEALRALESFARHGTVWRVAEELNLTRSAVSHRLRQLERDLGFRLFDRVGTRNELTPQALRYVEDVRTALVTLAGSADRHGEAPAAGRLTVSCTPGLASVWLCHRLIRFREAHPNIELSVVVPKRLDDISDASADLYVALGEGPWPGVSSELLFEVELTALCSPAVLNSIHRTGAPADLLGACLLHLRDRMQWRRWFEAAGLDPAEVGAGVTFSDVSLVYAAALAGQGIAIGDSFVCARLLESGALVRPFDVTIRTPRAYHLILPQRSSEAPQVLAFADWLRQEVGRRSGKVRHLLGAQASDVAIGAPSPKERKLAMNPARWGEQHIGPTTAAAVGGK